MKPLKIVYKYVTIDILMKILTTRHIRFTQPQHLNDPYEAMMESSKRIKTGGSFGFMAPLYAIHSNGFSVKVNKIDEWMCEHNRKLESLDRQRIISPFYSKYGVLSLTTCQRDELLWSYYGDDHRGAVIGFDASHTFFCPGSNPPHTLDHSHSILGVGLKKVNYLSIMPEYSEEMAESELIERMFYSKRRRWKHEKEVRAIKSLALANRCDGTEEDPHGRVHLFEIPKDCIQEVIAGARVSNVTKAEILTTLTDSGLSHIRLCEASLENRIKISRCTI